MEMRQQGTQRSLLNKGELQQWFYQNNWNNKISLIEGYFFILR